MAQLVAVAPLKVIAGSGQSLALTATTNAHFTNAVGPETFAIAVSLAPAATAYGANITVTAKNGANNGTAATASADYFIKSTDPPAILGCAPGDIVNVYPTANGTAYMSELGR